MQSQQTAETNELYSHGHMVELENDFTLDPRSIMHTVVFEGIDKVGKSSLMQALYKRLGYKITCVDRLYLSTFVYDLLRRQKVQSNWELLEENIESVMQMCTAFNQIADCATLVYVTADMQTVLERMAAEKHEAYFEGSREAFDAGLKMLRKLSPGLRIIVIDTTKDSIDKCVDNLCIALGRAPLL